MVYPRGSVGVGTLAGVSGSFLDAPQPWPLESAKSARIMVTWQRGVTDSPLREPVAPASGVLFYEDPSTS
jgi:hypothetical protein